MLQSQANLQQIRRSLLQELRRRYPEGESASMVRLILEHTGYPSPVCLSEPERVPGPDTIAQINEIVSEIHTGKPIQYILGYTYFCDLKIKVDGNVLIPRPETEEMVHMIVARQHLLPERILDIGTGSGCIALALKDHYPRAMVSGFDVNRKALTLASENGRFHGLDLHLFRGDILDRGSWTGGESYDLIVSNPPYVLNSERSMMDANVLGFEPWDALFVDDSDPLRFYRSILAYCTGRLTGIGSLWMEINERFGSETALLCENTGFRQVSILKDIHEKDRFIHAQR